MYQYVTPPPVSEQHRTAKVAVVFPVYNTARYLRECLDSILAQSYKNFVVFAVDDGSTDTSSQILDEYAAKDQRIVVNHKKNGGVARARNVALDAIENDGSFFYVAYVDSDDYVASDFLRTMVKHMDNAKADYGVCASEMFDKNGFIKLDYAMPPTLLWTKTASLNNSSGTQPRQKVNTIQRFGVGSLPESSV